MTAFTMIPLASRIRSPFFFVNVSTSLDCLFIFFLILDVVNAFADAYLYAARVPMFQCLSVYFSILIV